uniref:Uncharacterized protein orf60 n=1 Tax=Monomastix sp. (strain OKE-1) TaxID=141716 RepID=C0JWP9_MONSK|nr:hypothetical protein MoOKC_p065 [Monomastix sp. OKE-1]ACK36936.1 unknown [Monomastix sp. OKE-1]
MGEEMGGPFRPSVLGGPLQAFGLKGTPQLSPLQEERSFLPFWGRGGSNPPLLGWKFFTYF